MPQACGFESHYPHQSVVWQLCAQCFLAQYNRLERLGDDVGRKFVGKGTIPGIIPNVAAPKQPGNANSINESTFCSTAVKKNFFAYNGVVTLEVNKEATDRVQKKADNAINELKKGSGSLKDFWSATCGILFGAVLSDAKNVFTMVENIKMDGFTLEGCLPIIYFILGCIAGLFYFKSKGKEKASIELALNNLTNIRDEIDSMYRQSNVDSNYIADDTNLGQEYNYLSGVANKINK